MSLYQAYTTSKLGLTYLITSMDSSTNSGSFATFQLGPTNSTFVPTSFAVQVFNSGTGVKFLQTSQSTITGGTDPGGLLLTDGIIWRVDVDTASEAFLHIYRTGSSGTTVEITQISRTSGPRHGANQPSPTYGV